jgi:hypothetical protein
MRSFGIAVFSLGIALSLLPGVPNAASRSVFLGGHFHTFGYFIPAPDRTAAPKILPKLVDPLDFLRVYSAVPARPLQYPFLNPPRPETISHPLCTARTLTGPSHWRARRNPACPTRSIFGYSAVSP